MSSYMSSFNETEAAYVKELPRKVNPVWNKARLWLGLFVLHNWWFYMILTVFCCTFMNHYNPDSTKTHISSHTKHVFFNNSSLQKLHISSHPEHVFFHKGSHILSPKHAIFQRLFHRKLTYLPTQALLSKTPPQNINISSHTKHVFSITLVYRQFFHPLTQNMSFCMPSSTRNHISSHQTHALFQWLFHTNSIHICSHTNNAFFQRLFHRIFTHPLT